MSTLLVDCTSRLKDKKWSSMVASQVVPSQRCGWDTTRLFQAAQIPMTFLRILYLGSPRSPEMLALVERSKLW